MWNWVKRTGIGLLFLALAVETPALQAAKKASTEDQVAVLMKWYHTYFDEGKFKQAEQVAELAYELAPEDPQIAVALKLARRQQTVAPPASSAHVEAQLARVLLKLDRVERQLREREASRHQRTRVQIAKEPPGSPDSN